MVALLQTLAAGGAIGFAHGEEQRAKAESKLAEQNQKFQQKAWLEQATRDYKELQAQRQNQREDEVYQRTRQDQVSDNEDQRKFELDKLGQSHSQAKELEGMKESGRNSRALLNITNRSGGGSSSGLSQKDLIKDMENTSRRIFDLQKELINPMVAHNPDQKAIVESEIDRLQFGLAENKRLLKQYQGGQFASQFAPLNLQVLGR